MSLEALSLVLACDRREVSHKVRPGSAFEAGRREFLESVPFVEVLISVAVFDLPGGLR